MSEKLDCVVCGELCVDLPVRPVDQGRPLREMGLLRIDPIRAGGGGIVANSGIAMSRLGLSTAAIACVGCDVWGDMLADLLTQEGIDTRHVLRQEAATSATTILIGEDGEHTFAYHSGASASLNRTIVLDHLALFAQSRFALIGYYALMPQLERDVPEVLQAIRSVGCRTAMDAAAGGGTMQPLDRILPHLDVYVPSLEEAASQAGSSDPQQIIEAFRRHSPNALLGLKLGDRGALLSPAADEWIEIAPVRPPGPIVDTTGAGDCFYAGLIAGLVRGLDVRAAGQLAAAAGACSVTGIGAVAGMQDYEATLRLSQSH